MWDKSEIKKTRKKMSDILKKKIDNNKKEKYLIDFWNLINKFLTQSVNMIHKF